MKGRRRLDISRQDTMIKFFFLDNQGLLSFNLVSFLYTYKLYSMLYVLQILILYKKYTNTSTRKYELDYLKL